MDRISNIAPKSDEASLSIMVPDLLGPSAAGKAGKKVKGKKGEAMNNRPEQVSLDAR